MTEKTLEEWAEELREWPIEHGWYQCTASQPKPLGAPYTWGHSALVETLGVVRCRNCGMKGAMR